VVSEVTKVLDHVRLLPLVAKPYVRVFEPAWGDVLQSNPNANGRLSVKTGMPRGVTSAACLYLSDTIRGAFWETILRDIAPDENGGVYLDAGKLAKCSLQWIELVSTGLVLRLEPAMQRHVIRPDHKDLIRKWDDILATDIYELTHTMAGLVQLQGLAEQPIPVVVPGISFRSRQAPADIVYVFYEPPLKRSEWHALGTPISLGSEEGQQLVRDVLAQASMVWLNDPGMSGGSPPAGAL
jgi:hypothetical protein